MDITLINDEIEYINDILRSISNDPLLRIKQPNNIIKEIYLSEYIKENIN